MIDDHRYDYLRRKRYVIHEEHEQFVRPETLAEMREYEVIEFYNREGFVNSHRTICFIKN